MSPIVSVVVPVYGRPESLRRAVASALEQNVDLEVVVVDDASPEPVEANGWPDRVRIVRHAVNQGAGVARNTGVEAAAGEFVAFLDSDDVWKPGKVEAQLAALCAAREGTIGVFSPFAFAAREKRAFNAPAAPRGWFHHFLGGCRASPGSTLLFRRAAFARIGPQDGRLTRFEDWDWLLRAARIDRFTTIAGPGAVLGASGRPSVATVERCCDLIAEKWLGRLSTSEARRLKAALALERASARLRNDDRAGALIHLVRAAITSPSVLCDEWRWRYGARGSSGEVRR